MITQRSVVKWFDAKKGYGFVVNPQGGQDIFVHYSQIETDKRFKTLRTGQVIEYQLHDGPKGPHAINVSFLEEEPYSHQEEASPAPPARDEMEQPERRLFSQF
jgi:CspA family cold shock protein